MTKEGGDTEEMKIIRKRVNISIRLLILSGTSAGTAVQCGPSQTNKIPMIAGGESYQALVIALFISAQLLIARMIQNTVIFQYGLLDTHLIIYINIQQLSYLLFQTSILLLKQCLLIVEEDKADPTIANFEYGVSIFDLSNSKYNNSQQSIKQITNVTYHYVTHGDKFTLSNGKLQNFTVASYKNTIKEKGKAQTSYSVSYIVQKATKFVEVATNLMSSSDRQTWGETYETDAQIFRVNFIQIQMKLLLLLGKTLISMRLDISYVI